MRGSCAVDECASPILARGWCNAHYRRWKLYGDPTGSKPRKARGACSVDGCDRLSEAHALCKTHLSRWRRTGTTEAYEPVETRFDLFVHQQGPDECWEWLGPRNNENYGRVGTQYAHRVACERAHGTPTPGQVAMHSCDNPPCVNPAHLSWGTQSENVRDGWARTRKAASK
jgi:hypothetical protein